MEIENPLLDRAHRSADRQPSNSTNVVRFEKPKKRIPAKTERLIGELGLRYRPSVQADLEEHAAALALLTVDVADIPPDLLERAIHAHVSRSPYLPKASELITLAKSYVPQPGARCQYTIAAEGNASLVRLGRHDIEWIVEDGKAKLEWKKAQ